MNTIVIKKSSISDFYLAFPESDPIGYLKINYKD
jgi:hypothetical protein